MTVPIPHIVTCKEWGAAQPTQRIQVVGRPDKIIVHHTDGHAPDQSVIPGRESPNAYLYARMLQRDMQERRGWIDSGHNFLVMRSGIILQGRWGTVAAIERGMMVESAHCPGQNGNPGVEHEHLPGEDLTDAQWQSTVWLQAWICDRCGISSTALYGHDVFYPTDCPSNLSAAVPRMRVKVAATLNASGRGPSSRSRGIIVRAAVRREVAAARKP